jgi:polar amino acid transport system substrate-binding protein
VRVEDLDLVTEARPHVATGEPAFPPYVLDDDPTSKQGFEAAVAYAVANEMGFTDDQVVWVRAGFNESIAVGPKDFDFNIQQYSITEERERSSTSPTPTTRRARRWWVRGLGSHGGDRRSTT